MLEQLFEMYFLDFYQLLEKVQVLCKYVKELRITNMHFLVYETDRKGSN